MSAIFFAVNSRAISRGNNEQLNGNGMRRLDERPSFGLLLEELMNEIERHVSNIHVQLQSLSSRDRRRDVTALLPSTGGRPAFHITKARHAVMLFMDSKS